MRNELVIFDCDGVLVDSEPIAIDIYVALGARYGLPLTAHEVIEQFIGRSHALVMDLIVERIGLESAERLRGDFGLMHVAAVNESLHPVPGIIEALEAITIATCVASGGSHETMRRTLGRTGLYPRFEGRIFSASEVEHGKPAPDLFLHAAKRMGVSPAQCVVVEDSAPGVQAAQAAGMRCLAYAGGVTPPARLEGRGATLFTDMRDLPSLLEVL